MKSHEILQFLNPVVSGPSPYLQAPRSRVPSWPPPNVAGLQGWTSAPEMGRFTGWWLTYPSEKYEFVNGKDYSHKMKWKKCLKHIYHLVMTNIAMGNHHF